MVSPMYSDRQSGMAMLEVLISIVVLSFGLLGLAGLQLAGIKSNQTAYMRSVATSAAYDMADRMRANMEAVKNTNKYEISFGSASSPSSACNNSGCSPGNLASYDEINWKYAIATTLPEGKGQVTKVGNKFVIAIFWEERCVNGEAGCVSGHKLQTFETEIVP